MKISLSVFALVALANAAYVPSEVWSTLTPTGTYSGATSYHTHLFGIQIETISSSATSTAAVNQISDGQVQAQSTSVTTTTASVVNQISDGQILGFL